MKQLIIIWFIFNTTQHIHGQFNIESNFNIGQIGRSQSIQAQIDVKKRLSFIIGAKYNFNHINKIPIGRLYQNTSYATNFGEHLGAIIGVKYNLYSKDNIHLKCFFESHYSYSKILLINYYAVGQTVENPTSEYDFVYVKEKKIVGPILTFENNIGLNLNVSLTDKIYYSQKVGIGIATYKNFDKNLVLIGDTKWEFSHLFSFGVGFKFK